MQGASVLLSWGPPRMGTTWLFNVLRAMCNEAGVPLGVVADGVAPLPGSWSGSVIVKSHRADNPALLGDFDHAVDLRALVMMRDPEPTLASLERTQTASRSEVIGWLEADVASYAAALPVMSRVAIIREEWIEPRGTEIVRMLSSLLGLGLSDQQIASVAARFSRESVRQQVAQLEQSKEWSGDFAEYDRQTQWHAGHIGPEGPRTVDLTPSERERVQALRATIEQLTTTYALWDATWPPAQVTQSGPMEFIAARARDIARRSPRPGPFTRLRSLLRPSRDERG